MDHYLDFTVLPDPEFRETTLLGALVSKLHRRLVVLEADDIGISLPDFEKAPPLGNRLRVHGTQERIETLMQEEWLGGMRGQLEIAPLRAIPAEVSHRGVRRRQYKTNVERLRRRRMRRHGETHEEARERIPDTVARKVKTPFLTVYSSSSGQRFSLFIEHEPVQARPVVGAFNSYGISRDATIPWF
ncbi:type I-F CRISPR-associated endoribonuclease Cas6/Csy4 [Thioalkalivibrio paradoxus]|uniref:CRISPR-associated protein Csy4 n=1 Tax=Thioalkalivibrio paradoxus ARh 1 TaxID=713585 RepID=W0DL29_9GAMM|nr:type I-F CRISPR-associated endoribonuclease Cas6/Csy4 [Thioalkalivibrio paradoxus]AHE99151.1 CRISPR-associated protein Csy4 [Thioalkalivibrio paradoxus ARh 1]